MEKIEDIHCLSAQNTTRAVISKNIMGDRKAKLGVDPTLNLSERENIENKPCYEPVLAQGDKAWSSTEEVLQRFAAHVLKYSEIANIVSDPALTHLKEQFSFFWGI